MLIGRYMHPMFQLEAILILRVWRLYDIVNIAAIFAGCELKFVQVFPRSSTLSRLLAHNQVVIGH
jgi:hypothetical protein